MSGRADNIERVAPGLLMVSYADTLWDAYDRALWTECTLRKDTECALTNLPLKKGERAYRPVGNQQYRMRRISAAAIEMGEDIVRQRSEDG